MLKVYDCIATAHDLRLVGLAAFICVLASIAAIRLLRYARNSTGQMRGVWLTVSAISTGFGIWATHFVAMLAFTPGIPSGYNIALTVLSLVAAVLLTGMGLSVSLSPSWRHGPWVGGAIVAGGIAAMHYLGMAAFEIAGTIVWDPALVVASIALGALIGAIALPVGLHGEGEGWKIGGALLLTLAICSHHFTAMGAVSIIPDPTRVVSQSALPAHWLALGVAIASLAILGIATAGVIIDIRDRRRSELETDRMRDLADASVEGLLVCDGETIVSANKSFSQLAGVPANSLVGGTLERCFPRSERALQADGEAEPDGRDRIAPPRRLDDASRTDHAADRLCRASASCHRGSRPEGAQGCRAAYSLPGASRCADGTAEPQLLQRARRSGDRGVGAGQEPRRALPRSRPLQGDQRSLRSCGRRPRAADAGLAPKCAAR
jgi:NO-binding membrane sensor protein with MHYT domain